MRGRNKMKTVKFEIMMEVTDEFIETAKRLEHHAEEIMDLESYPEIKTVYGCRIRNEIERD